MSKAMCYLMTAMCIGVPVVLFILAGNFSGDAFGSLAIQVAMASGMMFLMMKMMSCDTKKTGSDSESDNK